MNFLWMYYERMNEVLEIYEKGSVSIENYCSLYFFWNSTFTSKIILNAILEQGYHTIFAAGWTD